MQTNHKTTDLKTHNALLWVFSFFLIGFILRIHKLGAHNLWFDELQSVRNLGILIPDYNPPLFYVLLSFWAKFFGPLLSKCPISGEFILRFLPMIFGAFAVPLIYGLGKQFFNIKTGLISAFILSISPLHIWYSQEARGYSLSVFLVMLTTYFFVLALKKNKFYFWIWFVILSFLGLYTNYFYFFIIILVGVFFIFRAHRSVLRPYLLSLCFIFFGFLPFLPWLFRQVMMLKTNFWIQKLHSDSIVITLENFNIGYNGTTQMYNFTFMVFSLLFFSGILLWWKEKKKELTVLALFIGIPIITTFLISKLLPVYLDRQMMLYSPFYYILVAAGLEKIKLRFLQVLVYLSLLAPTLLCLNNYFSYNMPLPQFHHIGVHVKKPVKPAADYINRNFAEGDIIAISHFSIHSIIFYLLPDMKENIFYFFDEPKFSNARFEYDMLKKFSKSRLNTVVAENTIHLEKGTDFPGAKSIRDMEFRRIWLISSSWARDDELELHVQAVRNFMLSHYSLLDSKNFEGIYVDLFLNNDNKTESAPSTNDALE